MSDNHAPSCEVQRPYANSNFLVDVGYGDPTSFSAGFCEVIFAEFRIQPTRLAAASESEHSFQLLTLRRGVSGMLDLYNWWNEARKGKASVERTVKITLLAEDLSPVFSWYFHRVRPVSLSYSPLNAMNAGVLIESIELAFESMEMR